MSLASLKLIMLTFIPRKPDILLPIDLHDCLSFYRQRQYPSRLQFKMSSDKVHTYDFSAASLTSKEACLPVIHSGTSLTMKT